MSQLPAPTAKDINEAHERAKTFADTAIGWAVKCGELLAAKKASLPHGAFTDWVEKNCCFRERQARRYMEVATKTVTHDRFDSMRQALGYDKPRPAARSEPAPDKQAVSQGDVSLTKAAAVTELPKAKQFAAATKPPEAKPLEVEAEPEWTAEDEAEYMAQEEANARARIEAAIAADDKLAEALEQIKQLSAELAVVKRSRDHYMNQAGEAVRLVKARDREIAKLKKKISGQAA